MDQYAVRHLINLQFIVYNAAGLPVSMDPERDYTVRKICR